MKVDIAGLTKEFHSARGRVVAVNDIRLEIKDGEFFVLLGPSGCGKSTTLNLIAGLEKATGGEIRFGEKLVSSPEKRLHLSPRERNVAMVFQSYALYPHLSAFENIAFPLRIAGQADQSVSKSVASAAAMLGIENLLDARPAELSGGQRQRVAIARAIVRQPSIFLLDEPLSNLDALLRASTRAELKNLQRSLGITTVYVTHDQVEAMSLGDRIALLREGIIEQLGKPEDLYERPANAFVARFIGSPPINLLKASLAEEEGVVRLEIGTSKLDAPAEKVRLLKASGHRECLLGIRPEYVRLAESMEQAKSSGFLPAKILQIEPLGRESLVHAAVDGQEIRFLAGHGCEIKTKVGGIANLVLDLTGAHFFKTGGRQESIQNPGP